MVVSPHIWTPPTYVFSRFDSRHNCHFSLKSRDRCFLPPERWTPLNRGTHEPPNIDVMGNTSGICVISSPAASTSRAKHGPGRSSAENALYFFQQPKIPPERTALGTPGELSREPKADSWTSTNSTRIRFEGLPGPAQAASNVPHQ